MTSTGGRRAVSVAVLLGACSFSGHPGGGDGPAGDDAPIGDAAWADGRADGSPADAIQACPSGQQLCSGRNLETCNASGTGIDPLLTEPCALTCVADPAARCAEASNIAVPDQLACVPTHDLAPPPGATIVITTALGASIDCTPTCGTVARITREAQIIQPGGATISWFCLGQVALPPDVTITVNPNLKDAIALFVTGDANLAGSVIVDGNDAGSGANGGLPGPGGTPGGARSGVVGVPAPGICGGGGGDRSGSGSNTMVGGGGGGGGNAGLGGLGGVGLSDLGVAPGGAGGVAGCVALELTPLAGGAGGGGGGDGSCGGTSLCGFAGGGGAGAIQIAAAGTITIGGLIRARGGLGFGAATGLSSHGGAGGGGAGGGVLLEAPTVTIAGAIEVTGGDGGPSGAGAGGPGASTISEGSPGAIGDVVDEGGSGGGGAAGIVRVNGVVTSCTGAAPLSACTTGSLP